LNRPVGIASGTTTYVNGTNTRYASNGALGQLQFGTSASPIATQTFTFDAVRQQPTAIAVTNALGTALSLNYYYCPNNALSCTGNNGNVMGQTIVKGT